MTKTVTFKGTKYPVKYGNITDLPYIDVVCTSFTDSALYLDTLTKLGIVWKYDGIDIDALPKGKYESNAYASSGQLADVAYRTFLHHGAGEWREVSLDQSVTEGESVKAAVQDFADRGLLYHLRLGALVK